MTMLLCPRPHAKTVDFDTARFVVGKACGLDVDGRHLEMGEEVPRGALGAVALRQAYEPPLRRIEVVEHAFNDDELRAECERHGVSLGREAEAPAQEPEPARSPRAQKVVDIDALEFGELVRLCKKKGVPYVGNTGQLRKRLRALLEG